MSCYDMQFCVHNAKVRGEYFAFWFECLHRSELCRLEKQSHGLKNRVLDHFAFWFAGLHQNELCRLGAPKLNY
jgi:hypothetical protein